MFFRMDALEVVMQDSRVVCHLSPFHSLALWIFFALFYLLRPVAMFAPQVKRNVGIMARF